MCNAQHYVSSTCSHEWMEITESCGEDAKGNPLGFGSCQSFKDNRMRQLGADRRIKLPHKCPRCDLENKYDGDKIRLILTVEHGVVYSSRTVGARPTAAPKEVRIICCTLI